VRVFQLRALDESWKGNGERVMSRKEEESLRQRANDSLTTRHVEQSGEVLLRTLTTAHIQQKLENVIPAQSQGKPDNTTSGTGSAQQQATGGKK
jgi:hypothetical protein